MTDGGEPVFTGERGRFLLVAAEVARRCGQRGMPEE